MAKTKRKYNDTFLDCGITFIERADEQLPDVLFVSKPSLMLP